MSLKYFLRLAGFAKSHLFFSFLSCYHCEYSWSSSILTLVLLCDRSHHNHSSAAPRGAFVTSLLRDKRTQERQYCLSHEQSRVQYCCFLSSKPSCFLSVQQFFVTCEAICSSAFVTQAPVEGTRFQRRIYFRSRFSRLKSLYGTARCARTDRLARIRELPPCIVRT